MEEDYYKRWTTSHNEDHRFPMKTRSAKYHCYTCIIVVISILIICVLGGAGAFYWYIFEFKDSSSTFTTYLEVPMSIRIEMEFVDAYRDTASPQYKNLTDTYINGVNEMFINTSFEDTYHKTNVVSLSPGSILVNSSSFFDNKSYKKETSLQEKLETLRKDIQQLMEEEVTDGMLGNILPVDPNSSLFVGTPVIIEEIPDTGLPNVTEGLTLSPTTSAVGPTTIYSTTPYLVSTTTLKPAECQSPNVVNLDMNVPFELFSPNFPSEYPPNKFCQWFIQAPLELRVRAHFNHLFLEDDVDFLYVGIGPGTEGYDRLAYTGTTAQVPLDIISPGRTLVFTFQSNPSVGAQGFSVRFEAVDPPGEDHVTCDNGLEVLVADDICDSRVECHDGSDEINCHDPLRTGICGNRSPITRILGGEESQLGSMPWVGSVRTSTGAHYCGATLLTDQWAITAAHCVEVADHLYFGGISLDEPSDYEDVVPISLIFAHPGYDLITENSDIALIRLARPVKISSAIRPICVAHVTEDIEEVNQYTDCRAVGWGTANSMGGLSPVLKEVNLPLVARDACAELSDNVDDSSHTKICAGGVPNRDTCTGDNGGPLVCRGEKNLWHLVGITTRSSHCKSADIDVYTRISAFHNFILYTVTQTDACIGTPLEHFCLEGCIGGNDCQTHCYEDQLQCKVGNCIPDSKACDGIPDCLDSTDEGFSQNCTTEGCGGNINILPGSTSIAITSPGYPNTYQSLQRCQWVLTTTPGNRVKLQFTDFETEKGYDFLHIGDTIANSWLSLSGDNVPIDILSLGTTIVVTFESDYTSEEKGFSLKAAFISENEIGTLTTCSNGMQVVPDPQERNIMCNGISECHDNSDEVECACGELQRMVPMDGFIEIESNNYGNGGYPEESFPCRWIVKAASPERRLEVTFIDFKTESGYDFLTIATSMEDNVTVVSYSGHKLPPRIVSSNSMLVFTFTTDHSGGAEGFRLKVTDIPAHVAEGERKCDNNFEILEDDNICDGVNHCSDQSDEPHSCKCGDSTLYLISEGQSSYLTSANYPSNYLHSANCLWLASLENTNQRLLLHFTHFSLEANADYLRIKSLNLTGTKLPLDIVSPSAELLIEFQSDYSISSTGFSVALSGIDSTVADAYTYCDNGLEVLGADDLCNNVIDCSDGSDESNCGT